MLRIFKHWMLRYLFKPHWQLLLSEFKFHYFLFWYIYQLQFRIRNAQGFGTAGSCSRFSWTEIEPWAYFTVMVTVRNHRFRFQFRADGFSTVWFSSEPLVSGDFRPFGFHLNLTVPIRNRTAGYVFTVNHPNRKSWASESLLQIHSIISTCILLTTVLVCLFLCLAPLY